MAVRNGLLITTSFISTLFFCCNNASNTAKEGEDSLNITAGTAVTGTNNTVNYLLQSKEHSIFTKLLKKTGLMETLNQPGPFTVFAPTNEAFEKLPASVMEKWNNNELLDFLSNHIVAGALEIADLEKINRLSTVSGQEIHVALKQNEVFLNGRHLSKRNVTCMNGRIYIIDETLVPAK